MMMSSFKILHAKCENFDNWTPLIGNYHMIISFYRQRNIIETNGRSQITFPQEKTKKPTSRKSKIQRKN